VVGIGGDPGRRGAAVRQRQVPPVVDAAADIESRAAYGDMETQTRGVLRRLQDKLANAGYGVGDIVKLQAYMVGEERFGGRPTSRASAAPTGSLSRGSPARADPDRGAAADEPGLAGRDRSGRRQAPLRGHGATSRFFKSKCFFSASRGIRHLPQTLSPVPFKLRRTRALWPSCPRVHPPPARLPNLSPRSDRADAESAVRALRPTAGFPAELATGSPVRVQRAPTRKWQVRRCYVNGRGQPTEAHVYTFYSEADAREVAGDLIRRIEAKLARPRPYSQYRSARMLRFAKVPVIFAMEYTTRQ